MAGVLCAVRLLKAESEWTERDGGHPASLFWTPDEDLPFWLRLAQWVRGRRNKLLAPVAGGPGFAAMPGWSDRRHSRQLDIPVAMQVQKRRIFSSAAPQKGTAGQSRPRQRLVVVIKPWVKVWGLSSPDAKKSQVTDRPADPARMRGRRNWSHRHSEL